MRSDKVCGKHIWSAQKNWH